MTATATYTKKLTVPDASIGPAVGEVFDDRGSRVRNACGAKFVREFAKRGLVKAVIGAREDQAAFAIEDLHTALRRWFGAEVRN